MIISKAFCQYFGGIASNPLGFRIRTPPAALCPQMPRRAWLLPAKNFPKKLQN
ncbi:putative hypothetical protein [Helicobacter mustelae 12198]|uniref:Uncharacterized protein n=1 Tax=Helicobacter mustelae (strain ATCC 43772 / CCUG 25715 / CIP 103759 / LMG 18044 / NCTC 12198 / R85-136P) TaxID=679897 RepID=D3UHZ8_HELM1|nr:putative hypothetical protein [Helicobacter mustelae 12198]